MGANLLYAPLSNAANDSQNEVILTYMFEFTQEKNNLSAALRGARNNLLHKGISVIILEVIQVNDDSNAQIVMQAFSGQAL